MFQFIDETNGNFGKIGTRWTDVQNWLMDCQVENTGLSKHKFLFSLKCRQIGGSIDLLLSISAYTDIDRNSDDLSDHMTHLLTPRHYTV